MGSGPAPLFANLFLYCQEHRLIKDIQKKDLIKARKLCNIFRFIDDFNAISDFGIFESNFKDTYSKELELRRDNDNNAVAKVQIQTSRQKKKKFQISLFDKIDSFPFSIVRMCEKSSNIPSNIFYMSTRAEYLRIARACNSQNSFLNSINPFVRRMISQVAKKMQNS